MRKSVVFCLLLLLLTGCSGPPEEMEIGMELRTRLLQSSGCSFDAAITADYGDQIHTFTMVCSADSSGDISFAVTEPERISGICGSLSGQGGELSFKDTVLAFEFLAEEQLSPVSAPWIFLKSLRGGYLTSACREDGRIRLSIDDSYAESPLRLDVWLNEDDIPEYADVLYDGSRILSLTVANFEIL